MTAVKLVLSDHAGDEVEMGPYNQGVHIIFGKVIDVATSREVAHLTDRILWVINGKDGEYTNLFIHAVEPATPWEVYENAVRKMYGDIEHPQDGQLLRLTGFGVPVLMRFDAASNSWARVLNGPNPENAVAHADEVDLYPRWWRAAKSKMGSAPHEDESQGDL